MQKYDFFPKHTKSSSNGTTGPAKIPATERKLIYKCRAKIDLTTKSQ